RAPSTDWGAALGRFTQFGGSGVTLFFVLSGFLVTGILLRQRGRPGYFRNFYARRVLRIFPLYYTALGVILVLGLLAPGLQARLPCVFDNQLWLWIYCNNVFEFIRGQAYPIVGHFWSLAVEEQFYLVWPPLVLLLGHRWLPYLCTVCMLSAYMTRVLLLGAHE